MEQSPPPLPTKPMRAHRVAYMVNVGANRSHGIRSPLFADGRFEFVPIPEDFSLADCADGEGSPLTYADLVCYNTDQPLLSLYPARVATRWAARPVHHDPNLCKVKGLPTTALIYGDVPYTNPRASSLRHAQPGDLLFFLANFTPYDPTNQCFQTNAQALYVIGVLEVAQVLEYSSGGRSLRDPYSGVLSDLRAYRRQVHVDRLFTMPHRFVSEPFSLIEGTERSARFERAAPLTAEVSGAYLTDKTGATFDFGKFRSPAACIGSYTRAIRPQFDLGVETDCLRFQGFVAYLMAASIGPDLREFACYPAPAHGERAAVVGAQPPAH